MQAGLAAGEAVPPEFVDLVKPHVQSFDYFLGEGLTRVVELLEPIEVLLQRYQKLVSTTNSLSVVSLWISTDEATAAC